jgi:hypothetical protein
LKCNQKLTSAAGAALPLDVSLVNKTFKKEATERKEQNENVEREGTK